MTFLQIKQEINKKFIQPIKLYKRRRKFKDSTMSIISVNCIGGGIAHDFGWRFLSPTVNLFMKPIDFLIFCENLEEAISLPLIYKEDGFSGKVYPIGEITLSCGSKIEIHFLHYNTFEEAQGKWYDRCKRVDLDRIVLLFSDQNECTVEDIKRFDKLQYPKLFFVGSEEYKNILDYAVYVKPYNKEKRGNINSIDHCMWFMGFSGVRRYEKDFDIESFFKNINEMS